MPGDTSEIVKRYLRESVTQTLEEYPDLDGFGVSHGEGMADMTPLERQQWVDEVLIAGMLDAKRPVKLIHRVPFSSGTSSEPGVSRSVEEVTRSAIERLGSRFSGPIWVEMKFNWSHAHSTPKLVKVHGGKLGDTYFDPPPSNYKVTWMARNEDFFALRWGVPDFIREHVARNAKASYVGGYFVGSETYIPALDYFTALREPVSWKWAFERQWLFYKLWGRLLYDPETPDAVFEAEFVRRYGERARGLLRAYSLASATQLRLASLYDSRWDFTLYGEGFLALQGDHTKYISVDQLIRQPVMDPDYVSVADFVAASRAASPSRPAASRRRRSPTARARQPRGPAARRRHRHPRRMRRSCTRWPTSRRGRTWGCTSPRSCAARSRCRPFGWAATRSSGRAPSPTSSARSRSGTRSCASRGPSTAT